jgi:hypothetical protein
MRCEAAGGTTFLLLGLLDQGFQPLVFAP